MKRPIYILILLIQFTFILQYNELTGGIRQVSGFIIDADSIGIKGASVKCSEGMYASYTNSDGSFSIPYCSKVSLIIDAPGYERVLKEVKNSDSLVIIRLGKEKEFYRDTLFNANELVIKVISNLRIIDENKLITAKNNSKLTAKVSGATWGLLKNKGAKFTAGRFESFESEDIDNYVLNEKISILHYDFSDTKSYNEHTLFKQKNTPEDFEDELPDINNFSILYGNEVKLANAIFESPFSSKALEYYDFKPLGLSVYGNRQVFLIKIIPKSELFPLFKGIIAVDTSNLFPVYFRISPGSSVKLRFIDGLEIFQVAGQSESGFCIPFFMEKEVYLDVTFLVSLIALETKLNVSSNLYDIEIHNFSGSSPAVETSPDSTKGFEFWSDNSRYYISPEELNSYSEWQQKTNQRGSKRESDTSNLSLLPYFDYNRVGSFGLGISPFLSYKEAYCDGRAYYSFGQDRLYGQFKTGLNIFESEKVKYSIYTKGIKDMATMSNEVIYPRLLNSAIAMFFYRDYFDYYHKNGWGFGLNAKTYGLTLNGEIELTSQTSLGKKADFALFKDFFWGRVWTDNPEIIEGYFRTASLTAEFGDIDFINISTGLGTAFYFEYLYGESVYPRTYFRLAEAKAYLYIPTFSTGYSPMRLEILYHRGLGSANLPVQYRFRMRTNILIFSKFGNFVSAPDGTYGGSSFQTLHLKYNLTDFLWRLVGLPLIYGRGLDISIAFSTGIYSDFGNKIDPKGFFLLDRLKDSYHETGFSISRIPSFVSNVISFSFDYRWGIGPVASGNKDWAFSIVMPL